MALEGSLRDMSLVDLIRFLRMRAKSGVLLLSNGSEHGAIYVSEGRLVDAALARGADWQAIAAAEAAVMCLLQWEAGTFTFQHDPSVARRSARISYDGEWLFEESQRRLANPLRALPRHPIALNTRVQIAALPISAESGINLDLDQWRILSQVAVSHDVRAICEATGVPPERAIGILSELAAIGLIEITHPSSADSSAQPAAPPSESQPASNLSRAGSGGNAEAILDAPLAAPPTCDLLSALFRRIRGSSE